MQPPQPRLLGIGAIAAGIGALALIFLFGGPLNAPGVVPGGSDNPGAALCVEPYTPAALAHRRFAFDGTVTAISGEQVTFTVNKAFRGDVGATIMLDASGMTGTSIAIDGGPKLAVGSRYLVAGDDHFAWGCGYTQPYDARVAAEWSAALGG